MTKARKILSLALALGMMLSLSVTAMAITADDFNKGNLSGIAMTKEGDGYLVTDTFNKVVWLVKGETTSQYAGKIGVADTTGEPMGVYQDGAVDKAYFIEPWDIAQFVNGYAVSDAGAKVIRYIDDGRVYTIEDTNNKLSFERPTGLTTDNLGNLYISDTEKGEVFMMDRDGHVSSVATGLTSPTGIVWYQKTLYVAETGRSRIVKIDEAGKVTALAGVSDDDGDGEYFGGYVDGSAETARFDHPQGITASNGALYISDTGNNAVRMYKSGRDNLKISYIT